MNEPISDDENPQFVPPDAQHVARRAMVLAAVVCRCHSDHDPYDPHANSLLERLKNWIDQLNLVDEMESAEKSILFSPLGTLDEHQRIKGTWHSEGLAILAWALNLFPLPKYDEKISPFELTDSLYFLNEEAADIIDSALVRSLSDLKAFRELMYAIHCRLRGYLRTPNPQNIAHWIEPSWLRQLGIESPLGPGDDLLIGKVELCDADKNLVQQCEWAICERHRASIWLIGEEGPEYSRFPVDT